MSMVQFNSRRVSSVVNSVLTETSWSKMEYYENSDCYHFSDYFALQNGYLFCENVDVKSIKAFMEESDFETKSPVFVYSKNQIISNIESYKETLKSINREACLNYAMKANMNPAVLELMRDRGCSVTLVSGFELRLALRLGFEPSRIVLNGNGKQGWEIELAVERGCLLNIDGWFNLQQTIAACRRLKKVARVLLRINPNIDAKVHKYNTTGTSGSKFGIEMFQMSHVVEALRHEPLVHVVGVHSHLGSTITDIDVFRKSAKAMMKEFSSLKASGFQHMKYINLGGGLGIDYTRHASRTMKASLKTTADFQKPIGERNATPRGIVDAIHQELAPEVSLILEPGRSLIGDAAVLLTRVLGVKHGAEKSYIVVDGSMTEVIRPALYGAYHHIELVEPTSQIISNGCPEQGVKNGVFENEHTENRVTNSHFEQQVQNDNTENRFQTVNSDNGVRYGHLEHGFQIADAQNVQNCQQFDNSPVNVQERRVYEVVGPVCESGDFLGHDRLLATPHEGCHLAVFDVGAYCTSMSSNYNMRPRPAELLVDGSKVRVIRQPDSFETMLQCFNC
ncbi:uncharacterized protein LOC127856863 isoform X3 [Dreissena polymorpha]|nr:uncharacterized protein LOC127856863 isoform X3 [Dreissena polymorpha]